MHEAKVVGSQVEQIINQLTALQLLDTFRSVSLIAPSGTGKSRVVREFYEHLRSEQDRSDYWPSIMHSQSGDPLATRKVLGPAHDHVSAPSGALPEFLWISVISGDRADGHAMQAIHQVSNQLDLHALPILYALNSSSTLRSKMKRMSSGLADDLRDETYGTAFGKSLETVIGQAIPMSGLVLSQCRRLAERTLRVRAARKSVEHGYVEDRPEDTDLASRLASDLAEIGAVMPTIVAIEDSHLLDETTARLLKNLRDLDAQVLVVGTTWPEGTDRETYAACISDLNRTKSHTDIELARWARDELMELAQFRLPDTDPAVLRAIADRFRTPLTVELFLSLRSIQKRISDGHLNLSPADVAKATNDDKGLYQQRWNELDPLVQQALVLAMAVTGAHNFGDGSAFIREMVADIGRGAALEVDIGSGLESAAQRDHWTAEMAGGIDNYREPLLADLVLGQLKHWYLSEELSELGRAAVEWLERRLPSVDLNGHILAEDDLASQWFIALHDHLQIGDLAVLGIARLTHGTRLMAMTDFSAAVKILEAPLADRTSDQETLRRSLLFDALSGAGRPAEAVQVGAPLVQDLCRTGLVCEGKVTSLRLQLGTGSVI